MHFFFIICKSFLFIALATMIPRPDLSGCYQLKHFSPFFALTLVQIYGLLIWEGASFENYLVLILFSLF